MYIFVFIIWSFIPVNVFAYLDPGTGSYIVQMIMAGLGVIIFGIKMSWERIKIFSVSLVSKFKKKDIRKNSDTINHATGDKIVYLPMAGDLIHHGHVNVIQEGRKLGRVIVGLMTDKAVASYKRVPIMTFEQRKKVIENISGVDSVIAQDMLDYVPNIKKIKPDYFLHGSDWKTGVQKRARERVISTLEEWDGKLVEPEYTKGISSTDIIKSVFDAGTTVEIRSQSLRRALKNKKLVRIMEAHNGLTARIVENIRVSVGNLSKSFDGMWLSSLTDSTAKGRPDTGIVDFTSRLTTINNIFDVTTKPLIVDGDNGGLVEHFVNVVRTLERLGTSAVIIEDKVGAKTNSLLEVSSDKQDSIADFSNKISAGKKAQVGEDFMIIARIESLILGNGIKDALNRANAYVGAGADGIMIHSKSKDPSEIIQFCQEFKKNNLGVPLVAVPSTYNRITESELEDVGVNIVIYANHLLRSAYPAMVKTAKLILENGRAYEAEEHCLPIKELLSL
jgi:phosphoenolpyruvate phosphomutase / 2-hydroxyethylphosphonate cytidylyltransferase